MVEWLKQAPSMIINHVSGILQDAAMYTEPQPSGTSNDPKHVCVDRTTQILLTGFRLHMISFSHLREYLQLTVLTSNITPKFMTQFKIPLY